MTFCSNHVRLSGLSHGIHDVATREKHLLRSELAFQHFYLILAHQTIRAHMEKESHFLIKDASLPIEDSIAGCALH